MNYSYRQEINFKHGGKIGDLVSALPTIISYHKEYPDYDINLYLTTERADFNEQSIQYTLPLLNKQPYITSAQILDTARIDINLDEFRLRPDPLHFAHLGWGDLATYHRFFNLSEPWIFNIKPNKKADIIITKTTRYYGYFPWKEFIKKFPSKKMAFLGVDDEYKKFCKDYKTIKRVLVNNALETAQVIKGSKVYIGNQNGNTWIAEGMKVNRVLSPCDEAPNTYMIGKGAYSAFQPNILNKIKKLL